MMKSYVELSKGELKLNREIICKEALKTAEALKIDGFEPHLDRWYKKFIKDMNLKWDTLQNCYVEGEVKEAAEPAELDQVDVIKDNPIEIKQEDEIDIFSEIPDIPPPSPPISFKIIHQNIKAKKPKLSSPSDVYKNIRPSIIRLQRLNPNIQVRRILTQSPAPVQTSSNPIQSKLRLMKVRHTNLEEKLNALTYRMSKSEKQDQQLHQRLQSLQRIENNVENEN